MNAARQERWIARLAMVVWLLPLAVAWRLLSRPESPLAEPTFLAPPWADGRAFGAREHARWNGRNPFAPASVPGSDDSAAAPALQASASYRPVLVLQAIVGGPPWTAVLKGVPGRERPVVVAPGDVIDSLRVLRIDATVVSIAGPDTVWNLRLEQGRR